MADEADVLFVRGNGNRNKNEGDDVWDDSVLIEAYEKAVNASKQEILKRICPNSQDSLPKQKSQHVRQQKQQTSVNKARKKWAVGAPCRAVYTEDGEIYEAVILKIFEDTGTCIIKFVGYGNTQKVKLETLLESEGLQNILAQEKNALAEQLKEEETEAEEQPSVSSSKNGRMYNGALGERMECETENVKYFKNSFMAGPPFNSVMDMMPPAPPLPPQLMAKYEYLQGLPENDADALSSMLMSWYISGFHTGYYHGLKQAQSNQEKRKNC